MRPARRRTSSSTSARIPPRSRINISGRHSGAPAGTAPAWELSQRVMPQELFRIRAAAIRMCGVCLVESADTSGEVADHRTARQSLFYLSAAAVTSQSTGRASRSSSAWRTLRPSSCRSVCFWLAKFFKKMTARNCAATQSAKKHRAQAVHGHLPHSHLADGDGECQHVAWSVGGICEFDHIGASFVNDAANTAPLSEDPPVDCAGRAQSLASRHCLGEGDVLMLQREAIWRGGRLAGARRVKNVVRLGVEALHASLRGQVSQLSLVHSGRMDLGRCVLERGSKR
jgi:hypothetical protein